MEHLVVTPFVDDLGCLEQLGVLALDVFDQLAAHQHGAVFAGHQGRQPPAGHRTIDLDPLGRRQAVPEFSAVNVDKVVGDQPAVAPAIAVERLGPVDIGRGVPLVELGLLVEVPHVRVLAVVIMAEVSDIANVDLVPAFHKIASRCLFVRFIHRHSRESGNPGQSLDTRPGPPKHFARG